MDRRFANEVHQRTTLGHRQARIRWGDDRGKTGNDTQPIEDQKSSCFKEYEAMSKEELSDALVMAQINEARLKKGYSVKGSGVEKKYLPIDSGNIK